MAAGSGKNFSNYIALKNECTDVQESPPVFGLQATRINLKFTAETICIFRKKWESN
jgi:hypothetical protein